MSEKEIQRQVEIINAVTEKALQSKESARQILIDAKIIDEKDKKHSLFKSKKGFKS